MPPNLLAVPNQRRPLFPGFMAPLVITDEALVQAMIELKKTPAPFVGVFMVKDPGVDLTVDKFSLTSVDQVHRMGTLAHIQQLEAGQGGAIAMLMAHRRVLVRDVMPVRAPPLVVRVEHLRQPPLAGAVGDDVKATSNEILATLRDIIKTNPLFQQHVSYFARRIDVTNPYALADFAASLTTADPRELQDVLEALDLGERLRKALVLLKKELQLSQLQASIKADVEKRVDKQQRQYFLMEQLRSIKKELGMEKDDKDALVTKYQDRVSKLKLPATARVVVEEELEKLQVLERNSSEFNVTRTYLDWMTTLPWGKTSEDNFDLAAARRILDEDHYGMKSVKDRILEFIAVGKLRGSVQGKIICMVGPPGVGKTSIGKSIARALDRQFYRFSVGGLSDVAEIKGHRRTYVGAMPGKLIQALKLTGVSNPLVLIDEIDKIGVGRGHSGDPTAALLEMLDPNQNGTFMDHYLDTPVDASKVLFICTANTLDTIPGPLLDRMEVIQLSGYDAPEKVAIAKQYLDPRTRKEMGLDPASKHTPKSLRLTDDALEELIRWYAREAGVRNLEKLVGTVYRKAAIQIVEAREARVAELKAAGAWPPAAPPAAAAAAAATDAPPTAAPAAEPAPPAAEHDSGEPVPVAEAAAAAAAAAVVPPAPKAKAAGRETLTHSQTLAEVEAARKAEEAALWEKREAEPLVEVENDKWTVTKERLEDYVGKPKFTSDRMYEVPPPGVVMGLGWSAMGGAALYIEVVSPVKRRRAKAAGGAGTGSVSEAGSVTVTLPSSGAAAEEDGTVDADAPVPTAGGLRLTGKLGDVMQESAQIAYTVARRVLHRVPGHGANGFLDTLPLHMHVPEGATPKDGPSAGVTMTTALLSLAMNRAARPDLAMTGEVSLTGLVLPVGGIKEKVMAARRAHVSCLVLPHGNVKDWEELPGHLKDGMEVHFARTFPFLFVAAVSLCLSYHTPHMYFTHNYPTNPCRAGVYDDVFKVAFNYSDAVTRKVLEDSKSAHPVHVSDAE